MGELKRRMASSRSWGVEGTGLLTPAEVKAMVPFIDETVILGGFYTPGVGIVDSLQAGTLMRQKAQELGALTVAAGVEVTGIDVEDGRVRRVHTDAGTVETEVVVIACGVWSPRIARMAGASIPLTPAVHQMIDVGPVPQFEHDEGSRLPVVRDMDTNMYERQRGTGVRDQVVRPPGDPHGTGRIPSSLGRLSPTMRRSPKRASTPTRPGPRALPGDRRRRDGWVKSPSTASCRSRRRQPDPRRDARVKNLWSVAAVWIKGGARDREWSRSG
jgi:glycine/D-amino acid oxidase-like deaminating enzyme